MYQILCLPRPESSRRPGDHFTHVMVTRTLNTLPENRPGEPTYTVYLCTPDSRGELTENRICLTQVGNLGDAAWLVNVYTAPTDEPRRRSIRLAI